MVSESVWQTRRGKARFISALALPSIATLLMIISAQEDQPLLLPAGGLLLALRMFVIPAGPDDAGGMRWRDGTAEQFGLHPDQISVLAKVSGLSERTVRIWSWICWAPFGVVVVLFFALVLFWSDGS